METEQVGIETQCFDTASEFMAALRPSADRWRPQDRMQCDWVFRGQGNAAWPLVPSAWRAPEDGRSFLLGHAERFVDAQRRWVSIAEAVISRFAWCASPPTEEQRKRTAPLARQVLAELHLIREFAILADDVGHPVPPPWWLDSFDDDLQEVLRGFVGGKLAFDDIWAFAQHHGVPTRLLDWTYHPLVAAYFAAEGVAAIPEAERPTQIAVWALHRGFPAELRCLYWLKVARHLLPFLHAQHGVGLLVASPERTYMATCKWPTIEEIVRREVKRSGAGWNSSLAPLRKYTLPASESQRLLELLWAERISKAHLMPTYDNVTQSLGFVVQHRATP